MISEEKIIKNWEEFLSLMDQLSLHDPRWAVLKPFYQKHEERIALMPASSRTNFHNAFPGGYVDHILRVHKAAHDVKNVWKLLGANIDFTDIELSFTAINHDLGKFGDDQNEEYIPQDSDWHRKRGELYKHNPAINYMKIDDRSLFILQKLGISLTEKEYLAIKLHDGLYEESNKSYYMSFSDDYKLKSNLPYILHQADLLSARVESQNELPAVSKPVAPKTRIINESGISKSTVKAGDEYKSQKLLSPQQKALKNAENTLIEGLMKSNVKNIVVKTKGPAPSAGPKPNKSLLKFLE